MLVMYYKSEIFLISDQFLICAVNITRPFHLQVIRLQGREESDLKLHTNHCDKLYRWSMWRMYLNEELSRVVLAKPPNIDQSNTISSVTSSYTNHPDGRKHGRQMKRLFRTSKEDTGLDNLSDNMYLVYGLPRVSLSNRAPEPVRQLHKSVSNLHLGRKQNGTAEDEIAEMFNFITRDVSDTDDSVSSRGRECVVNIHSDHRNRGIKNVHRQSETTDRKQHSGPSDGARFIKKKVSTKDRVSKQANIHSGGHTTKTENTAISSDILQKQFQLLKSSRPKRTSRDLWQTIRERRLDIVQMQEQEHGHIKAKKEKSKTSQLWDFIFARKKDLIRMKREKESTSKTADRKMTSNASKDIAIGNFEDPFQRELQQRLQERQERTRLLYA